MRCGSHRQSVIRSARLKVVAGANIEMGKDAKQKLKRVYSPTTLKILFALSRNQCAYPGCPNFIIEGATDKSAAAVIGQIAHIYALSEDGPRGKAGLTQKELNSPDNLLLLCPTHHTVVDKQYETYPAVMLIKWKADHERAFKKAVGATVGGLGFAELEVAAKALMSATLPSGQSDLKQIPPDEKIQKNGLGETSRMLLTIGAAKSAEMEHVLVGASQFDAGFPDRLRQGFVTKYDALYSEGLRGDDLFLALYEWSGNSVGTAPREAGLCVLSHLFIICDVFEK